MTHPFRILSCLRALLRDRCGVGTVEFAIVAAPFIALIIAIFQITTTFFAQQTLETAAEKAVRQLVTGTAQKAGMTKDGYKTLVCSKLPGFLKCANVLVDVRTVTSFSDADLTQPTITFDGSGNPSSASQYTPGKGGEITIARVMYVWSAQGGPLGFDISNMSGDRRLLTAVNVFKTEPY